MTAIFTSRYELVQTKEGLSFRSFCDLCDIFVETPETAGISYGEALTEAKTQARRYFNMCHKRGKWVCDGRNN